MVELLPAVFVTWMTTTFLAWIFKEEVKENTDITTSREGLFLQDVMFQDLTKTGRVVFQYAAIQEYWIKKLVGKTSRLLYTENNRGEK